MVDSPRIARTTIALMAGALDPHDHVTHHDGRHCVALSPAFALDAFYLEGTLDELAAFVLQLAGVVRELNARELAAISTVYTDDIGNTFDEPGIGLRPVTFDGTRAPVQAVVDELQARR